MSNAAILTPRRREPAWLRSTDPILIGKDIMELLSSSMYVDRMSIYREYVQNAADSIDEVRKRFPEFQGRVIILVDNGTRTVTIRDNGGGIPHKDFLQRLTAFGASGKRGAGFRGFRGVGRLAGIGYCQQLIFRSHVSEERCISELQWDCRKLRGMLREHDFKGTLQELVQETTEYRTLPIDEATAAFFEVELRNVVRHGDDGLLNTAAIDHYLSQVAPVPFDPEFPFSNQILRHLGPQVALGNLEIMINGATRPVYRPHQESFDVRAGLRDTFAELECRTIDGDDGPAAVGWLLHHSYLGALPPRSRIGGLRLRVGNIQVGTAGILEDVFSEPRFNAWCVGEFHIIDQRIVPNGRRDHFEQNTQLHNLFNQLGPLARTLTQRARSSSLRRKYERELEQNETAARQKLTIVKQGSLALDERERFIEAATKTIGLIEKIIDKHLLAPEVQTRAEKVVAELRQEAERLINANPVAPFLSRISPQKRAAYNEVFSLVYEFAPTEALAKEIVDRMLARLRHRQSSKSKSQ